jgi:hypothetical protein
MSVELDDAEKATHVELLKRATAADPFPLSPCKFAPTLSNFDQMPRASTDSLRCCSERETLGPSPRDHAPAWPPPADGAALGALHALTSWLCKRRPAALVGHGRTERKISMPKGHMDVDRQLDALAHVIVKDDIGAVAAEWGITRNGVYKLAHSALMRLQRAMYS